MKTRDQSWLAYQCLNKSWTFLHFSFFCDYSKCPQPWLHKQNHPRQKSARQKPQGKSKTRVYLVQAPTSSDHRVWFFFFPLGPCGLSQDIPFICPGQTPLSLSKIGIDSHAQPTSYEKMGTSTLWVILLNCYRKLPSPAQSMEKGKYRSAGHSEHFPYFTPLTLLRTRIWQLWTR